MEKSDVTSMRKSKSHEGGIAELLNFKQKNKDMNEFIKVPMSEKLAYCFGDPALTLIYIITTTLLTYFYTNVVGISVGAVGMILLLSRVFDGFSDVLMGTIIDRTHSKYGKARIWILRLALPYAAAAVLLFTMPPFGNTGKIIYAFLTYNLMNTVGCICAVLGIYLAQHVCNLYGTC